MMNRTNAVTRIGAFIEGRLLTYCFRSNAMPLWQWYCPSGFPQKTPELMAYQKTITGPSQEMVGGHMMPVTEGMQRLQIHWTGERCILLCIMKPLREGLNP